MTEKSANAKAVEKYHNKLVNLAIVRVPSEEHSGVDYKAKVFQYLCDRYGEKKPGVPNKSMNEYILDLIETDMNKFYKKNNDEAVKMEKMTFAKGVKELK